MRGTFLLAMGLIVFFVRVGPTSACKICTGPCTCVGLPPLALNLLASPHPPPPPPHDPPPTALELSIQGPPAPLGYLPPGYLPPGYLPPGYLPPGYLPPGCLPPSCVPPYAPNLLPDYALGLYANPPAPLPPPCKYCGKKIASGHKCNCFAKNYLYADYC